GNLCWIAHGSILSKRASRRSNRCAEGAVEIEPVHHRRQRIGPCAIVSFTSLAAMPNQLCPLQHREVLGDSRLRYARIASQCVDGLFALPGQLLENGPARRIGESPEH